MNRQRRKEWTATIPSGGVSEAIELGGGTPTMVVLPDVFTGTQLSFQVSIDGTSYHNLYSGAGEVLLPVAAGVGVPLVPGWFAGLHSVKFRSGTAAAPTAEGAARELTVFGVGAGELADAAAGVSTVPITSDQLPAALAAGGGLKVEGISGGVTLPATLDETGGHTILRAAISAASSGDNTLVAAVTGKKIKVLGIWMIASGDVDVRLESGAGGTALTGVASLAADGNGYVLPMSRPGLHWFETAAAALLNLELSGAVQVSGSLVYYAEA